jgi:hypothetical protein
MTSVEPLVERLYSIEDLVELRRNTLRYARAFPPGNERNQHRQVASRFARFSEAKVGWRTHTREGALPSSGRRDWNET